MITTDLQEQIEKIDSQLLQLLADRVKLYQDLSEQDLRDEMDADALAMWIEEASDKGVDEAVAERLCKHVILMCRKGQE